MHQTCPLYYSVDVEDTEWQLTIPEYTARLDNLCCVLHM